MALGDAEGYRERAAKLRASPGAHRVSPDDLPWIELGDPMLANVRRALQADYAGKPDEAGRYWARVAAQARLTGHQLATTVAAN